MVMAAALGLVAVAGCGGTGQGGDGGQAKAASKGGTLHVLSSIDLEHLDPARNYVTSSQNVGRLVYRTLTTFAAAPGLAGGKIVPDLATDNGRPSDDARTWTFTLRAGVKFEDGRPITSQDIKYGVERTFAAELPEGPPYGRIWLAGGKAYKGPYKDKQGLASIETPDDRTIVFKLNRPVADFGSAVSLPMFAPVPRDKDNGVKYDSRPFSSGPYKIENFEAKKQLTLVRNTHWSPDIDPVRKGLPDKIVIDLLWKAAQGIPITTGLGAYAGVKTDTYSARTAFRWVIYHFAELTLLVGVIPVSALIVLFGLACAKRSGFDPAERAFLATAAAGIVWLVIEVGIYASRFGLRIEERNMFSVAPICCSRWCSGFTAECRGRPR